MTKSRASKKQARKAKRARRSRGEVIPAMMNLGTRNFTTAILAYSSTIPLTEAGASVGAQYYWRLNSIYDPDYTGTGNVASGYGEMGFIWGRYRVLSCRVVLNISNTVGGNQLVGMSAGLNSTMTSTVRTWPVQPNTWCKLTRGTTGGPYGVAHFDKTFKLHEIAGITKKQYLIEDDYAGIFGSNPAINIFLATWLIGESGNTESSLIDIRLFYKVQFFGPLQSIAT